MFFNWSLKRKAYIDFERQNMSLFFSLMPNFYMADWILFKFSKRKKREREKHPYFGSEASHGKFHFERISFCKYASSKWQCGYNRICLWTSTVSCSKHCTTGTRTRSKSPAQYWKPNYAFPLGLRLLSLRPT